MQVGGGSVCLCVCVCVRVGWGEWVSQSIYDFILGSLLLFFLQLLLLLLLFYCWCVVLCVFAYLVYKPNRLWADGNIGSQEKEKRGRELSISIASWLSLSVRFAWVWVRKSFGLFDYALTYLCVRACLLVCLRATASAWELPNMSICHACMCMCACGCMYPCVMNQ